jgi:hypothetical protein
MKGTIKGLTTKKNVNPGLKAIAKSIAKSRGTLETAGKKASGSVGKTQEEGKLQNVAEKTVASATGMKRGGAVDKMGRAVKRKTADVKGRAMKGK